LVAIKGETIMAFPDRIERTLELAQSPDRVWAAITTEEGLGTWFGNRAKVDLRVGGEVKLDWDSGDSATLTIERLDPETHFSYSWSIHGLPADDPRRTLVEFTVEAVGTGTTLTVVESGFAQVTDGDAHRVAFSGNTEGWASELGELVAYLDAQDLVART
jgi:uncharacterized protein YndB with AHSA1/START domain